MNDAGQQVILALQTPHRIGLLALSILLLALVLELVRRGLLRERYALLWIATALAGVLVGAVPGVLTFVATFLHFQYVTVLLALTFLFTLGLVLSFSVVLSRLSDRNRKLAQEVALLAAAVEELERRVRGGT